MVEYTPETGAPAARDSVCACRFGQLSEQATDSLRSLPLTAAQQLREIGLAGRLDLLAGRRGWFISSWYELAAVMDRDATQVSRDAAILEACKILAIERGRRRSRFTVVRRPGPYGRLPSCSADASGRLDHWGFMLWVDLLGGGRPVRLSTRDLVSAWGCSAATARRLVASLRAGGLLRQEGAGTGRALAASGCGGLPLRSQSRRRSPAITRVEGLPDPLTPTGEGERGPATEHDPLTTRSRPAHRHRSGGEPSSLTNHSPTTHSAVDDHHPERDANHSRLDGRTGADRDHPEQIVRMLRAWEAGRGSALSGVEHAQLAELLRTHSVDDVRAALLRTIDYDGASVDYLAKVVGSRGRGREAGSAPVLEARDHGPYDRVVRRT